MPRRLLLLAHAETNAMRQAVFADREDLNAAGVASLSVLPSIVPSRAEILSSPALAARSTAACLGANEIDQALRDLDAGAWAGRPLAEIAERDPKDLTQWISDPGWSGHGGESVQALVARIGGWLEQRRTQAGVVMAVTHASIVRAALVATLDAPGTAFWRIDVPPLACLTLGTDGRRWSFRALEPIPRRGVDSAPATA